MFAKKEIVTLASNGRCSFLALGDTKLQWVDPINSPPVIWTYTLNYTKGTCKPYGGNTISKAALNITNGMWLPMQLNCAYYIVLGNKAKVP